jgi:hypothetical protein
MNSDASGDLHIGGINGALEMFHDPIVEEVRAIREQLAAQFDFDIRKIVADAQQRQATYRSRIVSFERPNKAQQQAEATLSASQSLASQ